MKDKPQYNFRKSLKRIPLTADEPQNLAELFLYALRKYPRKNALNFKSDGKWVPISTNEMLIRIENIALGLYSLGLRNGEKAAILASNSPEWTLVDAGCQFNGIVDVPIYTTLTPDSIQYILKDSGAKLLFLQDYESYEYIKGILPACESVKNIVLFGNDDKETDNLHMLEQIENLGKKLKMEKPSLLSELLLKIDPQDIATLIYTSGTTGEPKGVMLSHENLLSNAIDACEKYKFTSDDTPLSVLPLSHVFERTGMYLYILNGMAVHYAESFDKVPENMREVRPTMFVGVPRIFEKVYAKARLRATQESHIKGRIFDWAIEIAKRYALDSEKGIPISTALTIQYNLADKLVFQKLRDFFGGRLEYCITGGAALSDTIYLIFTGAGIPIMQGYGLTETSPVVSSSSPQNIKLGTVGKIIRNVEARIANDGEIEITGPGVMLGYFNKLKATQEVFTDDGWFKTGDIGELDEDRFLKITDRKKELFKTSGGKYIAPSPIEQMIKGSNFVNQVVLIGNARKFASALIVPDFDQLKAFAKEKGIMANNQSTLCQNTKIIALFEKEVAKNCDGLARFETVKKIILLENDMTVESGELTPTLKIKRRVIDGKYQELIDKIYLDAEKEKLTS